MSSSGSVTHWLNLVQAGEDEAAQQLWSRYCDRLVRLARNKLGEAPRAVTDEEDIALDAFASFCRGAAQGRFPVLQDRDNLWRLLVVITARKVWNLRRDQHSQRHHPLGRKVVGEAKLGFGKDEEVMGLVEVMGQEPTPAFAAEVADECRHLLGLLDENLRQVAIWKMEGYTNAEIAERLGCIERTVERKLESIRAAWGECHG